MRFIYLCGMCVVVCHALVHALSHIRVRMCVLVRVCTVQKAVIRWVTKLEYLTSIRTQEIAGPSLSARNPFGADDVLLFCTSEAAKC